MHVQIELLCHSKRVDHSEQGCSTCYPLLLFVLLVPDDAVCFSSLQQCVSIRKSSSHALHRAQVDLIVPNPVSMGVEPHKLDQVFSDCLGIKHEKESFCSTRCRYESVI